MIVELLHERMRVGENDEIEYFLLQVNNLGYLVYNLHNNMNNLLIIIMMT